jgi:hypothetical protein
MENNCISPRLFAFAIAMLAVFSFGITKVMAQEWDHEYVPFVEEGKTWNCTHGYAGDLLHPLMVDCIFTIKGDTVIGENSYKKVFCQYEEYYGDKELHFNCAVREDSYKVYIVEQEVNKEILLYDFSQPKETLLIEINNRKYPRLPGYHLGTCPTNQYSFKLEKGGENFIIYYGTWFEGVGYVDGNPFALLTNDDMFNNGKGIWVVSCKKETTLFYQFDWLSEPDLPSETTSIEKHPYSFFSEASSFFDLYGRRLTTQPKHGLYIRDGKKYVVK